MKRLLVLLLVTIAATTMVSAQLKDKPAGVPIDPTKFPSVPDLILNSPLVKQDGSPLTLNSYRGNFVLLTLWATWAKPVEAQTQFLVETQEKYGSAGLTIIGLNVGNGNGSKEKKDTIEKFADKFKVNFDLVEEFSFGTTTDAIYNLTRFNGIPQALLIDREGKLRGVFLGGGDRVIKVEKQLVEDLMKEKQPVAQ